MLSMHLVWSLWAFSFSHVALPPALDLGALLRRTVAPVATVLTSAASANDLVERVTQVRAI